MVQAVRHCRPYLWGRSFVVRTDHNALKFILDQRLSTIPQHQWVSKLFGFDFSVEFRPGRLNVVADALSQHDAEELQLSAVTAPSFSFYDEVRRELVNLPELEQLRKDVASGAHGEPWAVTDGLITHHGRIMIPATSPLLIEVLRLAHTVAHVGVQKTLQRLRADFYVEHDHRIVRDFVRACTTCQRNKTEALHPAGLL